MQLSNNTLLQGGKYRIVRFISAGGFGCTYEGVHTMMNSRVAIKEFFVNDFCNRDEETSCVSIATQSKKELVMKLRQKFIDEARAVFKMQHPNIVRVTDFFEENGTAYYVMDYIDGLSLNEIVKQRGALSEEEAVGYIRQVCDALKYVHSQNRLHLDIKPGNIMIDGNGHAILIDFGASKQYDEAGGENTSTLLGKTPGYAPIEQMGNDLVKFTPCTDIYALGATLYKLLTGITPPNASLLASGEELQPLPNNISQGVRKAITESMKINKVKRPQNIDEFICLLSSYDDRNVSSDDATIIDNEEESPAIIPEMVPKPKANKERKPQKTKVNKKIGQKDNNDMNSEECELSNKAISLKIGGWLKFFLVILCLNGIGMFWVPVLETYNIITYYDNDELNKELTELVLILFAEDLFGLLLCALSFCAVIKFIRRKPNAVYYAKLCLWATLAFLVWRCLYYGFDTSYLVSIIWTIIYYIYLLKSKNVSMLISFRKVKTKDYVISILLFMLPISMGVASLNNYHDKNTFKDLEGVEFTYSGGLSDGLPNGKGEGVYPYGRYEGEYLNGIRQGRGILYYEDDEVSFVFDGLFENDIWDNGRMTYSDESYFQGKFNAGAPYTGKFYDSNGKLLQEIEKGEQKVRKKRHRKSVKKQEEQETKESEPLDYTTTSTTHLY